MAAMLGFSKHPRTAAAVVLVAVFMTNLGLLIVNVALPAMGETFSGGGGGGASLGSLSWVLNAYAITFAALLVVAGRAGDRIGQRPVFLIGIAVFTLASLGCALAPNLGTLVVARIVQAVGAAAQIPTSLALLLATVPTERRTQATRSWAAVGGLAAAAGPVAGGLLTAVDWRWVFAINLPIGITALVAGRSVLPKPAARETGPLPDLLGALLLISSVTALSAAGAGTRLGLDERRDRTAPGRCRDRRRRVRPQVPATPPAAVRTGPAAAAALRNGERGQLRVRRRLRDHAAVQRAVVPGTLALECTAHGSRPGPRSRPRTDRHPSDRPRRATLRTRSAGRRGRFAVRRRHGVVRVLRVRHAGLLAGDAAQPVADRCGRRSGPGHAGGRQCARRSGAPCGDRVGAGQLRPSDLHLGRRRGPRRCGRLSRRRRLPPRLPGRLVRSGRTGRGDIRVRCTPQPWRRLSPNGARRIEIAQGGCADSDG
ncbi:hypothetical protein C3492_36505 [Streptomyces sp. Ru62]|nr:hypothetical protein C3492_36505 [Streptomyces sp. Ru62]